MYCKIFRKIYQNATTPASYLKPRLGHDGPPAMTPLFSSLRKDSLGVRFLPANYSGDFAMRAFMHDGLLSGINIPCGLRLHLPTYETLGTRTKGDRHVLWRWSCSPARLPLSGAKWIPRKAVVFLELRWIIRIWV